MNTPPKAERDGQFPHTFAKNPLVGDDNTITMNNVGDVLAYVSRTLLIQHEAHHCPNFDLAPFTYEEFHGLLQIHRLLEDALRHDAPPTVLVREFVAKD